MKNTVLRSSAVHVLLIQVFFIYFNFVFTSILDISFHILQNLVGLCQFIILKC